MLGVGTIGHCRDFYALKLRDFDAPMAGSLYLTHDNPDLRSLFEVGRELATYRDATDCVEKVRHYLARDAEREIHRRRRPRARHPRPYVGPALFGRHARDRGGRLTMCGIYGLVRLDQAVDRGVLERSAICSPIAGPMIKARGFPIAVA